MGCDELQSGYYATIPRPVLDDAALRWPAMVLYAHLTSYARKSGFCYAKNATLIKEMTRVNPKTGAVNTITERTLQSLLAELRDRGHISMDTGPLPPDQNGVVRQGRRIFIGTQLADMQKGEKTFTPENNFAKGVKKSSPHTTKVKQGNNTPLPPTEVMDRIAAYAGEDEDLADAILGLVLNRQEALGAKKAVKTLRTMNGILNDLDTRSNGDRRVKLLMLAKAVKNNWLTVYALKPDELPKEQAGKLEEQEGVTYF